MDKLRRFLSMEIHLPEAWFSPGKREWLAAAAVALFLLSPLPVAARALYTLNPDCLYPFHPRLIHWYVWPLAGVLGYLALFSRAARLPVEAMPGLLRRHPVLLLFLFTALWMLLSQTAAGWIYAFDTYWIAWTLEETLWMQLAYLLLLFPVGVLLRSENKKNALVRMQLLVSIVLALAAFVLWHGFLTDTKVLAYWPKQFSAIYTNINYYGYYLSVSIPLAAAQFTAEKKPLWMAVSALAVGINTVALAYNNTMGAWVACSAAMVFLLVTHFILERRFNARAAAVVLLFTVCLTVPGRINGTLQSNNTRLAGDVTGILAGDSEVLWNAGSGRGHIWEASVRLIAEHPVFGIGFEGVCNLDLIAQVGNGRPHNEFMQYALFYGIPAAVTYFAGCFGVFLRALRRRKVLDGATLSCLTAAFGYLAGSFFGLTLYCTAPLLFLFLGMGYVPAAPEPARGAEGAAEGPAEKA